MNQRPASLKQEPCRGAPGCYCAPDWYAGCSCTCHNGSGQPRPAPRNAWNGLKRTGFKRRPKLPLSAIDESALALKRSKSASRSPLVHTADGLFIAGMAWPACWMAEKTWQATVEEWAESYGWTTWHCRMPQQSKAGWFDLAIMGDGCGVLAELKARSREGDLKSPTNQQWRYIAAATKAGWDVRVWDWPDDRDEAYDTLAANRPQLSGQKPW